MLAPVRIRPGFHLLPRPTFGDRYSAPYTRRMRTFAQLTEPHFDTAYGVVVAATDWLNANGIRQWDEPIPEPTYRERHKAGLNYGLFVDGVLTTVLTLKDEAPGYWAAVRDFHPPFAWLSTLAVDRAYAGQGLANAALTAAENHLAANGVERIYLDCIEGFLPGFYTAAGYTLLERREWPNWTMSLFERSLRTGH